MYLKLNSLKKEKGFALISVVTIASLLLIMAISMLSLSTVEVKNANTTSRVETARSNARVALMLAIAELQKTTGPDTRITAPADAYSGAGGETDDHVRQLTGAWRSWEGLNQDVTNGKPLAPDYDIKGVTYDEDSPETGRFLRWLVSGNADDLNDPTSPPSLVEIDDVTIPLLADGSLGNDSDEEVHLVPTEIRDANGNLDGEFAWWIQGENTKVKLKPGIDPESTLDAVEQLVISPGPSGDTFGIEDNSETDRIISHQSYDLLDNLAASDKDRPSEYWHDLSPYSVGLLTNNANGGWKRDLTLFSENFATITDGFSAFTLSPGNTFKAGKSSTGSGTHPLIYPWTEWSQGGIFPQSVSWSYLASHMNLYKSLTSEGEEVAQILTYSDKTHANIPDIIRRLPVLARVHFSISLSALEAGEADKFLPAIVVNPVITMWNPYSVALDLSDRGNLTIELKDAVSPIKFNFKLESEATGGGATTTTMIEDLDLANITASATKVNANVGAVIPLNSDSSPSLWLPGEVRVFSPSNTIIADKNVSDKIQYDVGYRPLSGLRYEVQDLNLGNGEEKPTYSGSTKFSLEEATLDATFGGPNVNGVGIAITYNIGSGAQNRSNNIAGLIDTSDAKRMLGEKVALIPEDDSPTLSELRSDDAIKPVVAVMGTMRFARDVHPDDGDAVTRNDHNIVGNGIHHMSPVPPFLQMGNNLTDPTILKGRMDSFPYDILIFPVNDTDSIGMPTGIDGELTGYLGSGFTANDGLSNLILIDVPSKPIHAMGELQHFNVNAPNASPPYTLNAFGNSRANAFLQQKEITLNTTDGGSDTELGHDHSFAMNHVFLDDWFVSTVSAQPKDWSSDLAIPVEDVYTDFLSGEEDLPNHYFSTFGQYSAEEAADHAAEFLKQTDAWEKVAGEIEVDGMVNINSTSEKAWQMLLKRNFSDDSPGFLALDDSTAGNKNPTASIKAQEGSPYPRTTLSSDESAGNSEFLPLSKPKSFTDEQIEALAREIVVEIKKRGPFLSLSEFYNRQLSDDDDLANAGAVESALIRLSEGTEAENPYFSIQDSFTDIASTEGVLGAELEFNFPKAAEGNPAYGFPGWTRQADVLMSIGSVLSVRDDTFTIRAYGASKDAAGNTVAEAWCEAVVVRTPEFVNGGDKYELPTETNHPFGRKYVIKQFRWLNKDEV